MKKSVSPIVAVIVIIVLLVVIFAVYKFVLAKGGPKAAPGEKGSVAPVPEEMGGGGGAGMGPQGSEAPGVAPMEKEGTMGGAMGDQGG